jgi:uncharacterized protein
VAGKSFLIAAFLLAGCGNAEPPKPRPALELTGRVVDKADLLDPATEAMLTARLAKLERETGAQMVIATTPSLESKSIADYSIALANAWGIGSRERNDGLLLLVAPNERQVRIEVGKGLEKVMTDETAYTIIWQKMVPLFRQNKPQTAILSGAGAMLNVMADHNGVRKAA